MITTEIMSLDREIRSQTGERLMLRQAVMALKSDSRLHMSQFVGVDRHFTGNGVVISFLPQVESEARCVIAGLVPYLRFLHGDAMDKCFTLLALEMHRELTWDPDKREVITVADLQVKALAEIDPEIDCDVPQDQWIINSPPKTKRAPREIAEEKLNEDGSKGYIDGSKMDESLIDLASTFGRKEQYGSMMDKAKAHAPGLERVQQDTSTMIPKNPKMTPPPANKADRQGAETPPLSITTVSQITPESTNEQLMKIEMQIGDLSIMGGQLQELLKVFQSLNPEAMSGQAQPSNGTSSAVDQETVSDREDGM